MIDWNEFNYGATVMCIFIVAIFLSSGVMLMREDFKINVFKLINDFLDIMIFSLMFPFLLYWMAAAENAGFNIRRIIWIMLIISLIRKFYIKFIFIVKKAFVLIKEKYIKWIEWSFKIWDLYIQ